jgi:hypothetical protein
MSDDDANVCGVRQVQARGKLDSGSDFDTDMQTIRDCMSAVMETKTKIATRLLTRHHRQRGNTRY